MYTITGVIQCNGFGHLKDMYFIPLQYDDPVPAQILPFDGPGTNILYMHFNQIYIHVHYVLRFVFQVIFLSQVYHLTDKTHFYVL